MLGTLNEQTIEAVFDYRQVCEFLDKNCSRVVKIYTELINLESPVYI